MWPGPLCLSVRYNRHNRSIAALLGFSRSTTALYVPLLPCPRLSCTSKAHPLFSFTVPIGYTLPIVLAKSIVLTSLQTKVRVFKHTKCLNNAEGILQLYQYFIKSLLRKLYKNSTSFIVRSLILYNYILWLFNTTRFNSLTLVRESL
jgi:hypothetical protein